MFVNVKSGVSVDGLKPEALFGMMVCAGVFADLNQVFTVTSVCDGKHMDNSLHYYGMAFDIRTRDLRGVLAQVVASRLHEALGGCFQVVVEPDHIHVEFQP